MLLALYVGSDSQCQCVQVSESTEAVRTASHSMTEGSSVILNEVKTLKEHTETINTNVQKMDEGVTKIYETKETLGRLSRHMNDTIAQIAEEIGQFKD